jgi:hypothetical protein
MNRAPFAAPRFAGVLAIGVAVATFVYRFNQLGGTLGGFENDHFVQLSTARQIVGGDMPFRDYNEIGAPLTSFSSAVGQMVGGHALLPDALLTIGSIALATAIIFWLAARASGSIAIASVITFIAVALAPRPYAYPKVLLYSAGILAAWRYVDRPSTARLAALGCVIGVAFLFRHDHGAYLGFFALAILFALEGRTRSFANRAAFVTVVAAAWAIPYLAVMQLNGGVVEYFRKAMVYASRDAERTSFIAPRLEVGSREPLVRIAAVPPAAPPEVKVRWSPATTDAVRREAEARYALLRSELREGRTWNYELGDTSLHNITALVRDPYVEDTDGIDRDAFRVTNAPTSGERLRALIARVQLAPELTNRTNAVAWLYYVFVAVTPAAAVLLLVGWRRHTAITERLYILPVVVLAGIVSITLLSRGATAIRLPDVSAPLAVLAAWMIASARSSGARATMLAVACLLPTTGAAFVLGEVPRRLDTADLDGGVGTAIQRTARVARELRASPPLRAFRDLDHPGSLRVAEYLNACTTPGDRVFVFGNYPEVYFFSGRLFAGSHVWLVPGFYVSDRDQQGIVERLQRWPVPIIVTEPSAEYDASYRKYFPIVTAFLDRHYRDVGPVQFGDIELRVLVTTGKPAAGTYGTTAGTRLPCFARGGAMQAAAGAR